MPLEVEGVLPSKAYHRSGEAERHTPSRWHSSSSLVEKESEKVKPELDGSAEEVEEVEVVEEEKKGEASSS